ncbi:hypothetical protein MASR2M12_04500 [Bacteroidales bacterium]
MFIGWDGNGLKPQIQFFGTASNADAGFLLRGVDYYTIEGVIINNLSSDMEYGIWLTNASAENGAHHNTIRHVEISLNKLNPNQTEGVKVSASPAAAVFDGNNHYNHFYNNKISNVTIGYNIDGGNSNTALMGVGNKIGVEGQGFSLITDIVMAGVFIQDQNGFSLTNTTIRDLTRLGSGTAAPAGISTASGNPTANLDNEFEISGNTIENLTSATTSIYGIYISARKAVYHINGNKIHNVTATGGGGNAADGIMVLGTSIEANIYNNMVSGIAAPASAISGNCATRGISVRTYSLARVYYNSVFIEFEATNLSHHSAAFTIYNNSDPVEMRNNNFVNKTTLPAGSTGISAAFYKRTASLSNVMGSTDNNIYYGGIPDDNHLIFYGHHNTSPGKDQTLEQYKARAINFDQQSFTEDVPFVAEDDLHIDVSSVTQARANAQPIVQPFAVDVDYDGMLRDATTPDIGADEISHAYPAMATQPIPSNGQNIVPVNLGQLGWSFTPQLDYTLPAGFKLYIGLTANLTESDLLSWTPFVTGQTNYSASLTGFPLDYATTYYWKVVPSVNASGGPDATGVELWQFTTEIYVHPYPNTASNPIPDGNSVVPVNLGQLGWSFTPQPDYTLPAGFKLYIGLTANLTESDLLSWTPFVTGQTNYSASLTGFPLDYATTYYWKVVPSVNASGGPDATGVELWQLTTQLIPWPNPVENPTPPNGGLHEIAGDHKVSLGWDFVPEPAHSLPTKFLIYAAADTNLAAWSVPVAERNYAAGQTHFALQLINHPNFNYTYFVDNFWKVIPVADGSQGVAPSATVWKFHFDEFVGIAEAESNSLKAYPNPASEILFLETSFSGTYELIVHDLQGKLILKMLTSGIAQVSLKSWPLGSYRLCVRQGNTSYNKLIIKN